MPALSPLETIYRALLALPPAWVASGVAALTAAESAVFLGLAIPGELTAVVGGALAAEGRTPLAAVLTASIVGPWAGDNIGYWLGRRYGSSRARSHRKHRARWHRARTWLRRKGALAVFLGRFTPFLRSVMPGAAGAVKMPYGRFLASALASGVLWGGSSTLAGYFGAKNLAAVAHALGRAGIALLVLVLMAAALFGTRALSRRAPRSAGSTARAFRSGRRRSPFRRGRRPR